MGALAACNSGVPAVSQAGCGVAMEVCALSFQIPYMATGRNPYDMRIKCEKPPLCYDMGNDVKFLNDPEVQKQLGVNMKFSSCNLVVNKAFTLDVLIYAGDQDFICNWLGNEKWTLALDWAHKAEFNAAEKKPFVISAGNEMLDALLDGTFKKEA